MREAAIRPLADCGQTRVWNLLIDVVAQSGSYPSTATDATQFSVTGERHYWQHVAIDRLTGQVLDSSVEEVSEAPDDIVVSNLALNQNPAIGTTVGTLNALPGGSFTYSLVSGTGGNDNALFTISGNTLQTAAALTSLTKGTYNILVQATGQNGQTYQQLFTVTINGIYQPGPSDTPTLPPWALALLTAMLFLITARFLSRKHLALF
jgi:hypothetical protein